MRAKFQGSAAERRALDVFVKLMRAGAAVAGRLEAGLAPHGLTHTQLGVLEALWHVGPLCQRDLAQRVLRSPASMTAVVDGLAERGLVRRERGRRDRRYTSVELTDAGRETIARVFPGHAGRLAEAVGALSAAEQEELARLCRKLGRAAAGADEAGAGGGRDRKEEP